MSLQKVAVVTGSNKGIGFAIVKELCSKFPGDVYLTSRNVDRGNAAVDELNRLGFRPKFHQLDIDDEKSVLKLRNHLKSTYGGLNVLVNNAGIGNFEEVSSFGSQAATIMRTNFFNTYRNCDILFPILKPHARVVNIASSMGHLSMMTGQSKAAIELKETLASPKLTGEQLHKLMRNFVDSANRGDHESFGWPDNYYILSGKAKNGVEIVPRMANPPELPSPERMIISTAYVVSKVAVIAMTRIQQRQFDRDRRPDLIVNCVHPGFVDTDMSSHKGPVTTAESAVAPSWLALLPENVQEPKGEFVWYDKQIIDWVHGPVPSFYY